MPQMQPQYRSSRIDRLIVEGRDPRSRVSWRRDLSITVTNRGQRYHTHGLDFQEIRPPMSQTIHCQDDENDDA